MSRHRAWWMLLTAIACATTSRSTYDQTRATEHVYTEPPEALLGAASRLFADQGLKPVRIDASTVQTPWTLQGVQATAAGLGGDMRGTGQRPAAVPASYQSYRAVVSTVDAAHWTVTIERLSVAQADAGSRHITAAYGSSQAMRRDPTTSPRDSANGAALETPGEVNSPPAVEREPAMEWAVLQKVDPVAATFIEQEPTVTSGCGQVRAPAPTPPAVLQIASTCPDVSGAIELLASRRLIVLGELHGTAQSPAFVGALACRTAAEGWPIAIALELPHQENEALQTFLASSGSAADRQAYMAAATSRTWQDGRSSAAILGLVEQLRALKAAGATVEVQGIDDRRFLGTDREAAMATSVDTLRRRLLDRPMLVLVGNVHAETRPGRVTSDYLPLSARLDRFGLKPVALVMAYDAGTTWACTLEGGLGCGVHPVAAWPPPARSTYRQTSSDSSSKAGGLGAVGDPAPSIARMPRSIRLWSSRTDGFDGQYYLGAVTASPPP